MTRLNLRCPDPIANALKAMAKKRGRSLSGMMLTYILRGLRRDGVVIEEEGQ